VGREVTAAEPTQVDHLPHACLPRGLPEGPCSRAVDLVERAARAHRVDEVVDRVDPDESRSHRLGLQHVPMHDVGRGGDPGPEVLGAAREAAHLLPALLERMQQAATDVARGTGEQDQAVGCDETSVDAASLAATWTSRVRCSDGETKRAAVPHAEQRLVELS
jgi:hypothetical protein